MWEKNKRNYGGTNMINNVQSLNARAKKFVLENNLSV